MELSRPELSVVMVVMSPTTFTAVMVVPEPSRVPVTSVVRPTTVKSPIVLSTSLIR